MEALLDFAAELEQRDAEIGRALDAAERLAADIDAIRADAEETAAFLDDMPRRIAQLQVHASKTNAERETAEAAAQAAADALERAQGESARLEAARNRQKAEESLVDTRLRFARACTELARAGFELEKRKAYAETLADRAAKLAPHVRDTPAPAEGLDGTIEWAARARGAILLERSNLERERDAVVRQAIELAANVSGEPAASVAGLRNRLARALAEPSP